MKKIFSILYSAVMCCIMTTFVAVAESERCIPCERAKTMNCKDWKEYKAPKKQKKHYGDADHRQAQACCVKQSETYNKGEYDTGGYMWLSMKRTQDCTAGYYYGCACWKQGEIMRFAEWKNGDFVCPELKKATKVIESKFEETQPLCSEVTITWLAGEFGGNNSSGGTIRIPREEYDKDEFYGKSWSEIRDIILKKRGMIKPDNNGSDSGVSGSGDAGESDSEEGGMSKIKEIKVVDGADNAKRDLEAKAKTARENLQTFFDKVDSGKSVWKTEDGSFNAVRLASDLTAGVVLGTVGGVVSGVLIKKSQVEKGFDALNCTVGGQKIADWGDEFTVGLRR